jgi:hypothetical protein
VQQQSQLAFTQCCKLRSGMWRLVHIEHTLISSNVALNAATSWVGSFWMKPTVSDSRICLPLGSTTRRVVGSAGQRYECLGFEWPPR